MPLLNVKNPAKEHRLVGVHLPLQVHSFLTLYSLAKGVSKSTLFKSLISKWIVQQKKEESDNDLILEIAQRSSMLWKINKSTNVLLSFTVFKRDIEKELLQKGISETYVKLILTEIRR